jgi:hypothetical protein
MVFSDHDIIRLVRFVSKIKVGAVKGFVINLRSILLTKRVFGSHMTRD